MVLFYILNVFEQLDFNNTFYNDLILRTDGNDSFLNKYYFFWTNFYYLPSFYFVLLSTVLLMVTFYSNRVETFFYLFFFFYYNNELYDFLISNYHFLNTKLFLHITNSLLLNTLNKYHPFLLFLSTVFFFINLYLIFNLNMKSSDFLLFKTTQYKLSFLLKLTVYSLFLGSWWALQEGSWGGWWDWDPSEVLGLLFLLNTLTLLHFNINLLNLKKYLEYYFFLTLVVLFYYFLIQLNFELVSHNFGIKSFFLFNNNFIYLELLVLVFLTKVFFLSNFFCKNVNFTNLYNLNYVILFNTKTSIQLNTLFVLYVILPVVPLLNFFFNNVLILDTLVLKTNILYLNVILIFYLLILFSKIKVNNLYLLSIIPLKFNLYPFTLITFKKFTFFNKIHLFLVFFFFQTITMYYLSTVIDINKILLNTNVSYYSLNFNVVEVFDLINLNEKQSYNLSWNVMSNYNSLEFDNRILILSNSNFFSIYLTNLPNPYTLVIDYFLHTILISYVYALVINLKFNF